jgi:hypothetical protein
MQQCIQCPDGSWVCGENPECPTGPGGGTRLIAALGTIQFEVELWHASGEPPYMVRLRPVMIESKERAR